MSTLAPIGSLWQYLYEPSPGYGVLGIVIGGDESDRTILWLANGERCFYHQSYFKSGAVVRVA